jgi:rfaE bifunctional protein nucleotidyltransferase chain/domain
MMRDEKIKSLRELAAIRGRLKREGKKVVFTNGCFDILHEGHVRLFRSARKRGDVLIVALNTDASVRKLKGPMRPVFPLRERLEVLSALAEVDYITWFPETTPLRIISALVPDVLVKGGDWKPDEVVGKPEVEAAGGRVVIIPYLSGRSSTSIIERIGTCPGSSRVPPRRSPSGPTQKKTSMRQKRARI